VSTVNEMIEFVHVCQAAKCQFITMMPPGYHRELNILHNETVDSTNNGILDMFLGNIVWTALQR